MTIIPDGQQVMVEQSLREQLECAEERIFLFRKLRQSEYLSPGEIRVICSWHHQAILDFIDVFQEMQKDPQ